MQRRGGAIELIRPGDRVFFEPGEEHWHGAAATRFMTHLALLEVDAEGNTADLGRPRLRRGVRGGAGGRLKRPALGARNRRPAEAGHPAVRGRQSRQCPRRLSLAGREVEAGALLDALDRGANCFVGDVLCPAAVHADQMMMVVLGDLVGAPVGSEVRANEEPVVDEPVERAIDRRPVKGGAGGPDGCLDLGRREVPAFRRARTSQISDRCFVCRRAIGSRASARASQRGGTQLRSTSAPQRSSIRRVFQRMTEKAQVATKRPTTT